MLVNSRLIQIQALIKFKVYFIFGYEGGITF